MADHRPEAQFFDNVQIGDRWISPARTITETDVVNFAGLTGDYDPLHVDHEHARNTPFGRPIAHGLLGMSLVAGLGSHSPWMRTAAFVRIIDWKFLKPIYIGDTVHVETEVVGKQDNPRRRGSITWVRRLVNHEGDIVQEGVTETLVLVQPVTIPSKPRPGRAAFLDPAHLAPAPTSTADTGTTQTVGS
jgi:3-hydroxybutyryl-CoA dehydratase